MSGSNDRFIGEPVDVSLPDGSYPRRDPPAPVSFTWRGRVYAVRDALSEWWDFSRLSQGQRTYGRSYGRRARRMGSFGLGRHYFLLDTDGGIFLLYYDRRPLPGRREGSWVLNKQVCPRAPADVPSQRSRRRPSDRGECPHQA